MSRALKPDPLPGGDVPPDSYVEETMEALIILAIIGSLLLFDALALRYGVDSRIMDDSRSNW